ncbi:SDR family oxidoreductase [Erythrobacter crassostreae]|uniref:SDR family oxidoreductase n=1 Tax=Erythrobacter crassostreae TaxID=2828328 RepID=A0A9X1JKT7_9SPHN|nr:SDR family oxidoreductase [Erythrobacter crassostrea]MBV7259301.1 SDR family oxidoreductase [Erythrobacter crassostrea]
MSTETSVGEPTRSIFITGGASGIGRAVAVFFAARGWFVGIADVNEAGMAETLSMITGGRASTHTLDVRFRDQWDKALADFAKAAGGRIDVVFNNAGIGDGGPLVDQDEDELTRMLDINMKGVIFGAQASHRYLAETAPGSVLLNTASLAGIIGAPGLAAYCATKWGVRGLTESLDAEWADDGIKVAALCPGFIDTPIIGKIQEDSNQTAKETLIEAGVEVSSVDIVPGVVWQAVHGDDLHYTVGKMAKRMRRLKRWMPGLLRKEMRSQGVGVEL